MSSTQRNEIDDTVRSLASVQHWAVGIHKRLVYSQEILTQSSINISPGVRVVHVALVVKAEIVQLAASARSSPSDGTCAACTCASRCFLDFFLFECDLARCEPCEAAGDACVDGLPCWPTADTRCTGIALVKGARWCSCPVPVVTTSGFIETR
jgi:hypothetical protein